ncbi:WD40 repeat-like protein [Neocallimastix lanati (nom. inval.)]|jgi:WD40 repeat protein|nr:WD40 repeat-like protein [Neocallimastix sp. JGI-2020a]
MEKKEVQAKPVNKKPLSYNVLTVGYPVFSLAFTTKHRLFIGGGGGVNRSGVKNVISLYVLNQKTLEVAQAMEHILPQNEDSVMSMCLHPKSKFIICGKNGTNEEILKGENKSLKVYRLARTNSDVMSVCSSDSMDTYNHSLLSSSFNSLPSTDKNDYRLDYIRSARVSESKNSSEYQKITEFDHEGRHILTGTTDGTFTLLDSSLRTIFTKTYKNDITDAHFDTNDEKIVVTTTKNIYILDIMDGSLIHEINNKSLPTGETCNFRAARFGNGNSEGILYAVANSLKRNKTFICKYNTKNWKLMTCKQVHNKPITSFAISPNGRLLGYGSADLSLGILSSDKLKSISRIKDAHGLPCTCLQFSRDSTILVSGSADGTCRISRIERDDTGSSFLTFIIFGTIVAIIAALYSQYTEEIMGVVDKYSDVIYKYTDNFGGLVKPKQHIYVADDDFIFPDDIEDNKEYLEKVENLDNDEINNIEDIDEIFTEVI